MEPVLVSLSPYFSGKEKEDQRDDISDLCVHLKTAVCNKSQDKKIGKDRMRLSLPV